MYKQRIYKKAQKKTVTFLKKKKSKQKTVSINAIQHDKDATITQKVTC